MKKLVFVILSVVLVGCTPEEEVNSEELASDINFKAREIYKSSNEIGAPVLELEIETVVDYRCFNFSLKTTTTRKGDEFVIKFEGIHEPGICLTAIGPATTFIELPENINKLTFVNGENRDEYNITITNEKVAITPINSDFTHSLFPVTHRFPKNSFAFVCGTNTDNTEIYNEFLNILRSNPAFKEIEFTGEGRIPYPESSSGHYVNHPSIFFEYDQVSDFEALESVLASFTQNNIIPNSGVSIALYGWKNRKYYSWMMQ